jgi:hypothetical protein
MPADAPIILKSRVKLAPSTEQLVRTRLAQHTSHVSALVSRCTVRFDDVNGPRGNGARCRLEVVVSRRPPVLVEQGGRTPEEAFAKALPRLTQLLERMVDRFRLRPARAAQAASPTAAAGGGVRAGAAPTKAAPAKAAATKAPAAKAPAAKAAVVSPRRGRGNAKARHAGATVAFEDSATRPSRKSTRRGANHGKPSQGKERTAVAKAVTPSARARRR